MRLVSLLWLAVAVVLPACTPQHVQADRIWTETDPPINATHIFLGEINRTGKPTGFHARPRGEDPKNARVITVRAGPNNAGVYTAQVEVRDPRTGRWKEKFSTFFPDRLRHGDVVSAILHAYRHRASGSEEPWRGPSGLGFPIQGYTLRDGRINTAYPVYVRDRRR
jgi:hypothetical protein